MPSSSYNEASNRSDTKVKLRSDKLYHQNVLKKVLSYFMTLFPAAYNHFLRFSQLRAPTSAAHCKARASGLYRGHGVIGERAGRVPHANMVDFVILKLWQTSHVPWQWICSPFWNVLFIHRRMQKHRFKRYSDIDQHVTWLIIRLSSLDSSTF